MNEQTLESWQEEDEREEGSTCLGVMVGLAISLPVWIAIGIALYKHIYGG